MENFLKNMIDGECERCKVPTMSFKMSFFNTQMICNKCQTVEENHPDFAEAKRKESEECMKGNMNFEGIGLPNDLKLESV
jgi:hypothetical protein